MKTNPDYNNFQIIEGALENMPTQQIPTKRKTNGWKKATVDHLELMGMRQLRKNEKFSEFRKMTQGEYTTIAVDFAKDFIEDDDFFEGIARNNGYPEWVRHYDFTGIILNAFQSVFNELDDIYRVESLDENSTNEFIRYKTELIKQNAEILFQQELEKMLQLRGFDLNRQDFQNEQERQQYQQELQNQIKSLTPKEIEEYASKNFKVLAVEWAQNKLDEDRKNFKLNKRDAEAFVDFLISGRWFRHYRLRFDSYDIERWLPEETFFSQDIDTKYPQKGEYVGRIRFMSISTILNTFGHLMNDKVRKKIVDYWGKEKSYTNYGGLHGATTGTSDITKGMFGKVYKTPFQGYFDHKTLENFEDFLGEPIAEATVKDKDGNDVSFTCPIPRMESHLSYGSHRHRYLRSDIELRRDAIRVTEGYWRSYKRMGLVVFENDYGQIEVKITDDDLDSEFLKEFGIKENKTISIEDVRRILQDNDYNKTDYDVSNILNTITYYYVPEVWKFVKIKGNGLTVEEDIYLDVKPLDFQIKGSDSDFHDVLLPVCGLIDIGVIPQVMDLQIAHNIYMNQITEYTMKELGILFAFSLSGIPNELQGKGIEEAIHNLWQAGKDTSLLPFDYSKANAGIDTAPIFNRIDMSYRDIIPYKWEMAKAYKQEAFTKLGITPEILGLPVAHHTAEGVRQGTNASMALMSPWIEEFNSSKTESINFHLAFAQFCEVAGYNENRIFRKSDSDIGYINILKEDPEIFPLRKLGVVAETTQKDRKAIETIRAVMMNNNTLVNDIDDFIGIMTSQTMTQLKQRALQAKLETQKEQQAQRESEERMHQEALQTRERIIEREYAHEKELKQMDIEGKAQSAYISAVGKAADSNAEEAAMTRIDKAHQAVMNNQINQQNINVKAADVQRKAEMDAAEQQARWAEIALKAKDISLREQKLRNDREIALTPKTVNIV